MNSHLFLSGSNFTVGKDSVLSCENVSSKGEEGTGEMNVSRDVFFHNRKFSSIIGLDSQVAAIFRSPKIKKKKKKHGPACSLQRPSLNIRSHCMAKV